MTSRRNVSSERRGADRSQTAGWLAACGGATRRVRTRAQLHIGAAAGGANVNNEQCRIMLTYHKIIGNIYKCTPLQNAPVLGICSIILFCNRSAD